MFLLYDNNFIFTCTKNKNTKISFFFRKKVGLRINRVTAYREFSVKLVVVHMKWARGFVDKEVWCLDLQFHLEAFELMMIPFFVNKKFYLYCYHTL